MLDSLKARFSPAPTLTNGGVDLDNMLRVAENHQLLCLRDGLVNVPEINSRAEDVQRMVFYSDYMRVVPAEDFESVIFNAVRFCFAYGVLLAEMWYSDRTPLKEAVFAVNEHEIESAVGFLEWSQDRFDALTQDATLVFLSRLNWLRNFSLKDEVSRMLSAVQALGIALLLKQVGIY